MRIVPLQTDSEEAERPEERSPTVERRDVRTDDEENEPRDHRHRRFRYEDPSSESEINAIDYSQDLNSMEAVWATVDSGAATSCLPVEMCKKMGLAITATKDLPFTNASGQPVHVHGVCNPSVKLGTPEANISGIGEFRAMDVAKLVDHSEEQVPVISVDYCFMNSKDDTVITVEVQPKHLPVLVVLDRWTKMVFAHVWPCKGVQKGPFGSRCLLNDLKKLGYSKMVVFMILNPHCKLLQKQLRTVFRVS